MRCLAPHQISVAITYHPASWPLHVKAIDVYMMFLQVFLQESVLLWSLLLGTLYLIMSCAFLPIPIKFPCTTDFSSSTGQGQADGELKSLHRAVSHLTLLSAAKPALNQLK